MAAKERERGSTGGVEQLFEKEGNLSGGAP
jgi:hypothetical protein